MPAKYVPAQAHACAVTVYHWRKMMRFPKTTVAAHSQKMVLGTVISLLNWPLVRYFNNEQYSSPLIDGVEN